ncbi:alpha/beta fold hydrolase [Candidatus Enterococcus mansonii]|uniref:AB hydrolase-1 domain-containing protein n=1 Tax=Candidatus Enterococcus mansonii TaxID=1834181 RepID=A0A242CJW7_9ENTE|nr:alpha/beta hydrolase [Enterococcus sp. 4G2_DIV0659]OTO10408.1 hypothetical protein A5880_001092 [Enterococcus sp. 4G2_DIV0659]
MKKQKKKLITADNSLIYYEITGQGFPILLLHGNGGSGSYFQKQISAFSKYYRVYTIDSREHGRSTNESSILSFEQMAEDVYLIMKQEHVKQADIIGFSDGANLAMVFTKNYPDYVRRLVLNAGNTVVKGVRFPVRVATALEFALFRLLSLFSKKAKKRVRTIKLMTTDIGVSTLDLRRFNVKTLVIVGKYDIIKYSHSIYLAKEIPNASFVIVDKQGHSFAKKAPEIFNKKILTFLKDK